MYGYAHTYKWRTCCNSNSQTFTGNVCLDCGLLTFPQSLEANLGNSVLIRLRPLSLNLLQLIIHRSPQQWTLCIRKYTTLTFMETNCNRNNWKNNETRKTGRKLWMHKRKWCRYEIYNISVGKFMICGFGPRKCKQFLHMVPLLSWPHM